MCCARPLHELSSPPGNRTPAPWQALSRPPDVLPRPDPFGRHTLGRQLVIRVTALVALAALLITIATALATRQVLMSQLDRQLDAVTARVRDPVDSYRDRHRARTAVCCALASRSARSL